MESLSMILNSRTSSTEEEEEEEEEHDEGPFIELEFSIPDEDSEDSENSTLSLSPSNDLFSLDYANYKPHPFPSSLLRSKFRIFALGGAKKPKPTGIHPSSPKQKSQNTPANYFVRFKVEQVPLVSRFTRENTHSEKVKSSREVVNKYFNKIKKLRFSSGHVDSVVAVEKSGRKGGEKLHRGGSSSPLRLETVRRRLGKSRSASSAVAAVQSPPRRRDDSLLQQQDGIQSAIAHCKRSFHAEKGSELQLVRSNSDPGERERNQLKFN